MFSVVYFINFSINNKNLVYLAVPPFSEHNLDIIEHEINKHRNLGNIIWPLNDDPESYFYYLPPEIIAMVLALLQVNRPFPPHKRWKKDCIFFITWCWTYCSIMGTHGEIHGIGAS